MQEKWTNSQNSTTDRAKAQHSKYHTAHITQHTSHSTQHTTLRESAIAECPSSVTLYRKSTEWCLSKSETVNSFFHNWKQNLQYTLSLDQNFAPCLVDLPYYCPILLYCEDLACQVYSFIKRTGEYVVRRSSTQEILTGETSVHTQSYFVGSSVRVL